MWTLIIKKANIATLILDEVDFSLKNITEDNDGYFIIIKGSIHQEDIAILNVYATNNETLKCMKQKLTELKREIDFIYNYGWIF